MRRLTIATLALAACSGDGQASRGTPPAADPSGPDAVVLRLPRSGGIARAYVYPHLDSAVASISGSPRMGRVLGFDPDAGIVGVVDASGLPRRMDLRLGEVRLATRTRLDGIASANGSEIYGITEKGAVLRTTPTGDWSYEPPAAAHSLFPQSNGMLVIGGGTGSSRRLWVIRPPDEAILDSVSMPRVQRVTSAQSGDRIYIATGDSLVGVQARSLTPTRTVRLPAPAAALAPAPSGDRLYIAVRDQAQVVVLDRYSESIRASVELPGPARDLRMDPLAQYVLARPAAAGDSAWLIAVGTNRMAGVVQTEWRDDLPAIAPGGTVATVVGMDVVFLNAESLQPVRTVTGGARDVWHFFYWNGFRPRRADLDQPVTFGSPISIGITDTTTYDSIAAPPMRDSAPSVIPIPPQVGAPARESGYLVSFATLLSEEAARSTAAGIQVGGVQARAIRGSAGESTVYRVVLGPYPTREEAERVGRESRRPYWVFEVER